jgi:hypothetical protein
MKQRRRGSVQVVKGERHFRGYDGKEILPDGTRPIWFVIRDWIAAMPSIFPFGAAWTERWRR